MCRPTDEFDFSGSVSQSHRCILHRVPLNSWTVVTSSNLNRFSKLFHHWKEKEISNKCVYYFPPHLKYVAALPLKIQKFKFVIKLPNKIKTRIIFAKKWKYHSYGWMDIVIITTVAQIVQRLLAHMREDAHATRQLRCRWRSGSFHAKHACSRHCYHFLWF